MRRLRSFLFLTLLGGVSVILPALLFVLLFRWLALTVLHLVSPLTEEVVSTTAIAPEFASILVVLGLILSCFLVGLLVQTRIGAWLHTETDRVLARIAPGYRSIRDTVMQLLGSGDSGLRSGEVALVRLSGIDSPVRTTAIVTARHDDGQFTVFVPTAPLPTQGFVLHLPASCVQILPNVRVEAAMRTVLSCGVGSKALLLAADGGADGSAL